MSVERRTWDRPTVFYNRTVKWIVYAGVLFFIFWSIWDLRISPARFAQGIGAGTDLVNSMFPPNFGERQRELIWSGMLESVAMAIVATIVGVIISLPVAFIAAENLVPRYIYLVGRSIVSIARAFHELVIAILAVVAVGFGALAGVITLSIACIGFFGKLLAEDIEDMDESHLNAIRATGASRLQVLLFGVIPVVMPRIVGLTIYRWDINIRASTIIGIVGAGGIGSTLLSSFDRYEYGFSMAIILVIIALVAAGEVISAYIRKRVQ